MFVYFGVSHGVMAHGTGETKRDRSPESARMCLTASDADETVLCKVRRLQNIRVNH